MIKKDMWIKWENRAVRKTRMSLQTTDGNLEKPLGLLEGVVMNSCRREYENTFVVVDFGRDPNYKVLLGRQFMCQIQMIQDWGYHYLYLRHEHVITRVNKKDHSYRDVTLSPVEEFDSIMTERTTMGSNYL